MSRTLVLGLTMLMVMGSVAATAARANDWAQWRGPEQNGVSREKGLPEGFDPESGQNLAWKNKVAGMSSPIVMNGRIYAWTRVGEEESGEGDQKTIVVGPKTQEALVCCDIVTGKTIWEYRVNMAQTDVPFHRLGWGNVAGDPKNGRVYGYGVQGHFVCLDAQSGKVVWYRQMLEEFGMISTFGGRTQSPAVDEDQVFLTGVAFGWGDQAQGQHRIFAFDSATGKLRWTSATGGRPVDAPYNTPVVAVVNGVRVVCFGAGDGGIYGFSARTGQKVFGYKLSKRGINASVLVVGTKLIGCSSEESEDHPVLGRVVCLDIAQVDAGNHAPRELWRIDGMEAGFGSPSVDESGKTIYVVDNKGTVFGVDLESGKTLWKQNTGTIGKASLVVGDGKIYAAEANGRFVVIQAPEAGKKKAKVLSKVELGADAQQLGREYFVFGSPAISDGRIYLQTAAGTYCIGPKDVKKAEGAVMELAKEEAAGKEVATVQVVPADVLLRAGESVKFAVRTYDAKGRLIAADAPATWEIGPVQIPAPPTAPPGTAPSPVGNLKGEVKDGTLTAQGGPAPQGGAVFATVADAGGKSVKGFARVRVLPKLPWAFDFEQAPVNKPPLTWVNAGGKFRIVELEDKTKALVKTLDMDLYHVARTFFGDTHLANYAIEADIKVGHKVAGGQRQMPDAGVVANKYTLQLMGNHQQCMLIAWAGALPKEGQAGSALYTATPFSWQPDTWYHFVLSVQKSESGGTQVRGKVWPRGGQEPEKWTVEMTDPQPNMEGSPGVFGESLVTPIKSEIWYDNIVVRENK